MRSLAGRDIDVISHVTGEEGEVKFDVQENSHDGIHNEDGSLICVSGGSSGPRRDVNHEF